MVLTATLLAADSAHAQAEKRFKVDKNNGVQVGFQNVLKTTATDGFKAGMWTPVLVQLSEDPEGDIRLPVEKDDFVRGKVLVETADNDGVINTYPQEFNQRVDKDDPVVRVVAYTKVGSRGPDIKVSIQSGDQTYPAWSRSYNALQIGWHLYLTLGESLPDFRQSLEMLAAANAGNFDQQGGMKKGGGAGSPSDKTTVPRFAVFEDNVQLLPTQWFGYSAVDMAILPTNRTDFMKKLLGSDELGTEQLKALAEWVRRGGRLVISVAPANSELVSRFLTSKVWQPALPRVLRKESGTLKVQKLENLQNWPGFTDPFGEMPKNGAEIVHLERLPLVEIETNADKDADGQEGPPLIVRFPYGMGSIAVMGFDVKNEPLAGWKGRFKFWQKVVERFAPNSEGGYFDDSGNYLGGNALSKDLSTSIHDELDRFDSPTVSFGWVVLFIFFYILVVGPVDYLLLKLVFKRLELTWLTFPTVVLTVSVLAYFTAYSLKGKDLKINKLDLIDIDLRSDLGADLKPKGAAAYGTTWFTILSPRIQNYTIGIEPVAGPWLLDAKTPVLPTVTWLGRAEPVGIGGTGRTRSQGLFNRTYSYEYDALGLRDVPIPVWTTKAFTASWAAPFAQMPLEVDLYYDVANPNNVTGTIKSNLPFELKEIGLLYQGKWYPLSNKDNVDRLLKEDGVLQVHLPGQNDQSREIGQWLPLDQNANVVNLGGGRQGGRGFPEQETIAPGAMQDPWPWLRRLLFFESIQQKSNMRNHLLRTLDWSWRVVRDEGMLNKERVREAVLIARLAAAQGPAQTLQADNDPRLGTLLWLGALPGSDKTRPELQGNLTQYTIVRVVLPVPPKKK
jgi:hypothetical protein